MNSNHMERRIKPFPATTIALSSLLSLVLLGWIFWNLYDGSSRAISAGRRLLYLNELRAEIVLLNEVLSTSAVLAATTGDSRWVERYEASRPKLDAALETVVETAETPAVVDAAKRLDEANVARVIMERRALDHVRESRLEAAQAILFSDGFGEQTRVYEDGLERLKQALDELSTTIIESMQATIMHSLFGGGAAGIVIVITWLNVLAQVRKWRRVLLESLEGRARAEQALRESHDDLESLVGERTRELEHAVAEHKLAREALSESRGLLQLVLNTLPLAVDLRDREGRYVFVNEHHAVFHRSTSDSFVGKTPVEVLGAKIGGPMMERHRRVIENGETIPYEEYEYVDASGTETSWLTTKVPVRLRGDAFGGVVTISLDITERKLAQTQLLQMQKYEAIGQLTSGIAHDFNNLMTIILGNLQLMERSLGSNAQELKRVTVAIDATMRGAKLTQTLVAFARKQSLDPTPVDAAGLISGMSDLIDRTIGEAIETKFVLADDLWLCMADATQLENAILNLAINARDAMPEGGKLTVEVRNRHLSDPYVRTHPGLSTGDYVAVEVSDNGCGMSPEVIAHAFEPFFTTKDVGKGSGLGLAMIYGFVKQSGGYLNLYSEEGHGTTVKMYFPRAAGTAVAPELQPFDGAETVAGGLGTILVVEDEPGVRDIAVAIFEELGYDVISAANGPEALAMLDNRPDIGLVFTDVVMPGGMTGVDLLNQVRARRPELTVVCTSGYAAEALNHAHESLENITLVQKPYSRDDLVRAVNQAMLGRGRRARR